MRLLLAICWFYFALLSQAAELELFGSSAAAAGAFVQHRALEPKPFDAHRAKFKPLAKPAALAAFGLSPRSEGDGGRGPSDVPSDGPRGGSNGPSGEVSSSGIPGGGGERRARAIATAFRAGLVNSPAAPPPYAGMERIKSPVRAHSPWSERAAKYLSSLILCELWNV